MNSLENQLQTLTLVSPSQAFYSSMEQEDLRTSPLIFHEIPTPKFDDFLQKNVPSDSFDHPPVKNYINMWCNDSGYYKGKFSTGATPNLTPKKQTPKELKKKHKNIKKSGFFKAKTRQNLALAVETTRSFENLPETDIKTPSPKKTKKNSASYYNSVSIKKIKNSVYAEKFDLDTTITTEEEDFNFIRTNINDDVKFGHRNRRKNSFEMLEKESRFSNDYQIIEIIGNGCFGTVYKCLNKVDGLTYAVKCTNSINSNNLSLNEAKALATFSINEDNPYIVRYFNAWIESQQLYLAMEYCTYSLRHLMDTMVNFQESQLHQILHDVLFGLKSLHSKHIVHLDIKPENILYSRTNRYKIADLGLSRHAIRSKGEDLIEGDCRYLAPELLIDINENYMPDLTKADIFSLGVMFYEILIGKGMPSNGEEWHRIRSLKLEALDRNIEISEGLKGIIRGMMNPNPELRPSAEELLNSRYLTGDGVGKMMWEKIENKILKEKVKELEGRLRLVKKKSF